MLSSSVHELHSPIPFRAYFTSKYPKYFLKIFFVSDFRDLPEICCYESVNWPAVESDSSSALPRRAVASCIPAQGSARKFEADCRLAWRPSPRRKSSATIARLPYARCSPAGRSGSSDCSAPVSAAVQACIVPPHLEHMVCSQLFPEKRFVNNR